LFIAGHLLRRFGKCPRLVLSPSSIPKDFFFLVFFFDPEPSRSPLSLVAAQKEFLLQIFPSFRFFVSLPPLVLRPASAAATPNPCSFSLALVLGPAAPTSPIKHSSFRFFLFFETLRELWCVSSLTPAFFTVASTNIVVFPLFVGQSTPFHSPPPPPSRRRFRVCRSCRGSAETDVNFVSRFFLVLSSQFHELFFREFPSQWD